MFDYCSFYVHTHTHTQTATRYVRTLRAKIYLHLLIAVDVRADRFVSETRSDLLAAYN